MKPIPPVDICKYFWTGDDTPTVVTNIPVGAVYINKTSGDHYLRRASGWVKQTLADNVIAGVQEASAAGLALLAVETPDETSIVLLTSAPAAQLVEGLDTFGPAAPASITVVTGVVTAASS